MLFIIIIIITYHELCCSMAFFNWYVWPAGFAVGLALWVARYPLKSYQDAYIKANHMNIERLSNWKRNALFGKFHDREQILNKLAIVSTCVVFITLASIELMVHFGHSWWYGLLLALVLAPVVMAILYILFVTYLFGGF